MDTSLFVVLGLLAAKQRPAEKGRASLVTEPNDATTRFAQHIASGVSLTAGLPRGADFV